MKKTTFPALIATGLAIATFFSCKTNEADKTNDPAPLDIRDAFCGSFSGEISRIYRVSKLDSTQSDTAGIDSAYFTISKGPNNTLQILSWNKTRNDAFTIHTSNVTENEKAPGHFFFTIPPQTIPQWFASYNTAGEAFIPAAQYHGFYSSQSKTFSYTFRLDPKSNSEVPITLKAFFRK